MALGNHSAVTEFILLGLSADPRVQPLLFVLFLMIYLQTLLGNLMLLLVIRSDSCLHTPMYFFLSHLSFLDLCFSSATVPKLLENLLSQRKTISDQGCLAQVFFLFDSGGPDACLLSVMAYDCYVAICHPLLYGQKITNKLCIGPVWGSWGLGFLDTLINILLATSSDCCKDQSITNYSCELPSLFPLFCSDVFTNFTILLCSSLPHGLVTCVLIVCSYTPIVSTILSISSSSGRSKAFSTFSSHLTAVLLFYGSVFLRYITPTTGSPLELMFSVLYGVVTPLVNPLIYSLKNKEVKAASLQKALGNHSKITEFILLGLSADPHIQALLFVLFLVIYLLTLMGNLTMLLVIRTDSHLHMPMYFFLNHLSFLDLCYYSVTVPKLLENLLSQKETISVGGCLSQVFFLFVTGGTEGCLLSVMAYDRYVAICHSLHYGQIMTNRLCNSLVCGSWGLSFVDAFINILQAMSLDFCENQSIYHYS
ncbi:olfactory receptor 8S1-like [Manis pentadactyla]|uniref:olfactory receptor 8S1-like n=1 Tax=Manis pentadactyla TaxID=143292 RepID=UPI00255CF9C2|nr:olfactory receptor 8S1-like [Manis pentadactyla]